VEAQSGARYPRAISSATAEDALETYSTLSRPASAVRASLSFSGGAKDMRGLPSTLIRDDSPTNMSTSAVAALACD